MNTGNEKDKEFINEVWKKVNYIQYEKDKLEEVKEIEKLTLRKKYKILICFFVSILAFMPILFLEDFDISIVVILSIYILGFCCYYENYLYF